jgi:hypothetical protein
MKYRLWCLAYTILLLLPQLLNAQARVTTVGIQFKPIFPVDFLGTGTQTTDQNGVHFDMTLHSGFSTGMLIRHGFSNLVAIEGGINYVKRNYDFNLSYSGNYVSSGFTIVGYEIPVSLLAYIQLGEQLFMNASMGLCADMYASNVESSGDFYHVLSVRKNVFQPAVIANLGWEWRTVKSGYFYIGASFHAPFSYEYVTRIRYEEGQVTEEFYNTLSGSYLTIDFRYFFHEEPAKNK